jgi:lipoprotein-anchoring transpeptidase ErfK/SrfK
MLINRLRLAAVAVLSAGVLVAAPAAPAKPLFPVRLRAPQQVAVSRVSNGSFVLVDESAGAVVRARPRGRILGRLSGETPLGTQTWLWALEVSRDARWARVVLPWRPNGRTGWVTLTGRRTLRTRTWVQIDVSQRRVILMRGDDAVASFLAAVGAPLSPTPAGRFSVTDPIATGDPSGPFGWFAFGLSGHQPHLPPGWTGGDQLAIHGTNDPASLGTASSAGCVRVSAAALRLLKQALRPGSPVVIHP